jgi:hypothetical protein
MSPASMSLAQTDKARRGGNVLEVLEGKDEEGHGCGAGANRKAKHQEWQIRYLDEADKIATKGLNKDFGFHINRPFYIISKLPFERVVECYGANNVWMKRWRANYKPQ